MWRDIVAACEGTDDDPVAVAADLDNAVAEFHSHFKPLVEKKVDQYLKELRESNAERKGGENEEPDRVRMQELWEEGYRYHITGEAIQFFYGAGATASGKLAAGNRYALAKPAQFDITDKMINRGSVYYPVPDTEEPPW